MTDSIRRARLRTIAARHSDPTRRRLRRRAGAVTSILALAVGAVVAVTAPTGAAGAAQSADVPAALARQHLTWSICYPGGHQPRLRCARVVVPLDWDHPNGPTISIEISRIKAADPAKRQGVLFTNPGGPGAPGIGLPAFIPETDPSIAAAFDLIGIDQRGVGESRPVLQCAKPSLVNRLFNLDGRDTSDANQAKIEALSRRYGHTCSNDPLTRYIHHSETVYDFDLVRQLLHENTINYFGFSGGTQLGAWYAEVFPQHVGRFVLDGNVDWTGLTSRSFNRQPRAIQTNFEDFLQPWLAKYDAEYGLGDTAAAVNATYEHRRAALALHPITLPDGTLLTPSAYDSGIVYSLYVTSDYPDIGTALSAIEHYPSATPAEKDAVAAFFSGDLSDGTDAFYSIICQNDQTPSYAQTVQEANYFRRHYPLAGANWNAGPCPFFTLPVTGSPVQHHGGQLPKLLMLNNDNDPATPLANALLARSHTPNARLVVVRNQAGHTIYGYGDECADGYANRWLLTGVLPAHDVTCPGLPLPVPSSSSTASAATASPATVRTFGLQPILGSRLRRLLR